MLIEYLMVICVLIPAFWIHSSFFYRIFVTELSEKLKRNEGILQTDQNIFNSRYFNPIIKFLYRFELVSPYY